MRKTFEVDGYLVEVLLPDLVGHDKRPAAFVLYLWLWANTCCRPDRRVLQLPGNDGQDGTVEECCAARRRMARTPPTPASPQALSDRRPGVHGAYPVAPVTLRRVQLIGLAEVLGAVGLIVPRGNRPLPRPHSQCRPLPRSLHAGPWRSTSAARSRRFHRSFSASSPQSSPAPFQKGPRLRAAPRVG